MDMLEPPPLPMELEYLWEVYIDIRKGCAQLTYIDIDAYMRVSSKDLSPWEADLMLEIDLIRCNEDGSGRS